SPVALSPSLLMPRNASSGRLLLRAWAEAATQLLAHDLARQIVFANRALGDWLGVDPGQLHGRRCDCHAASDDPLSAVTAGLCPPPEAFSGQVTDGSISRLASGQQTFERRRVRFVQIAGSAADEGLLLVVV